MPMQKLSLLADLTAVVCAHAEFIGLAELKALGVCPCRRDEGIGFVSMHSLLLLAKLKAWGVCPCSKTEGIGCVPMQ